MVQHIMQMQMQMVRGDPSLSVISCVQPDDYVLSSDDCDDSEPTVYEGADEVCDELDNNCDGLVMTMIVH